MTETAKATNPIEASATSEASATLLAGATSETDNIQQTQTTQTQEQNSTETAVTETKKTEPGKEDAAVAGVPEKYEFTAPEGKAFDPQLLESYSDAAKAAGLTQDVAQKLIEKMGPAIATRQLDQVKAIQAEWRAASETDKEFGGEKLAENLGIAKRAIDAFDPLPAGAKLGPNGAFVGADGKPVSTPLRTLLEQSGLGNHPEFLRLMYRAGKAISEDKFVGGEQKPPANASKPFYPNSNMT